MAGGKSAKHRRKPDWGNSAALQPYWQLYVLTYEITYNTEVLNSGKRGLLMNKLYRSQKSSMIAGVCGGLGNYFGIDPTFVRLLFVFLAFYHFLGVWVYIVMVVLLPQAPSEFDQPRTTVRLGENSNTTRVIGSGLVIIGILAVISTLDIPWFGWMSLDYLWPAIIILLGALLLARAFMSEE
jgi:phage shock protein PspC (stress-responsive transcriptional regulator)